MKLKLYVCLLTGALAQGGVDWRTASVSFAPNVGQGAPDARFTSLTMGQQLEVLDAGARLTGHGRPELRIEFRGAQSVSAAGEGKSAAQLHLYGGPEPRTGVASFHRIRQRGVYPGIDAVFHGTQSELEYDFVVAPGADPRQIRVSFPGGEPELLAGGAVQIGDWIQRAPFAYQMENGRRVEVPCRTVLDGGEVRFELGAYDATRELVIDPILGFKASLSTRGFSADVVIAAGADGSFAVGDRNGKDIRVAKFSATGSLLFQFLFQGNTSQEDSREEIVGGLAADATGAVFVAGVTTSTNLPTASNALQPERKTPFCLELADCSRADAYVLKLSSTGQVVWATYLGSNRRETVTGVAVSAVGRVYVTGDTKGTGFPLKNEFQTCRNGDILDGSAFLSVLNSAGTGLVYSTCLRPAELEIIGDTHSSVSNGVAVDPAGFAYIGGRTHDGLGSRRFPTRGANGSSPFQEASVDNGEAFIAKLNPNASGDASLVYSSYLGGSGNDNVTAITVDGLGQACVAGGTFSSNFPVRTPAGTLTPLNPHRGASDAFVTCFNTSGSDLLFSNLYGGSAGESSRSMALDTAGALWIAGDTSSLDLPAVNAIENLGAARGGLLIKLAPGTREALIVSPLEADSRNAVSGTTALVAGGGEVNEVIDCAREVLGYTITQGPIVFDAAANRFRQTVNIGYNGALAFSFPGLRFVLAGLPTGTSVVNPSGTTTCFEPGSPFFTLPAIPRTSSGGLNLNLEFVVKKAGGVVYTPRLASPGVAP